MPLEPCIPHLPDELVIQIFDSLTRIHCCPCHEEQAHYTIFDIAYLCRRFHRLISPFIYREFHYLKSGDGEHFLRTLASNPDLAALVECFEWNPDGFLHGLHDVNDRGLIADKFLEIGTPPAIRFAEGFRTLPCLDDGKTDFDNVGYRDDMFVEAVLMLTPNIKKVEVWGKFQPTFQEHPWTASMKLGIPHSFAHLSTVEFVVACTPLEDLTPLIFLPSLKSLCLHEVGRPDEEPWTPEMFYTCEVHAAAAASRVDI
ncbi:hypothetical protein BCR34DRAFT_590272 [Clohesyomyces aquaticus]|uniref:F-box domain-containing protein n=1 Tax=Clohesyomyces aquaticus TaxID=1231657 RepID=A0A1Y1ZB79_9PLEO|nr:hypothetical protein BCR34DRAFT_590272 [Clohesyomyces aquaticus]